MTALLLLLGLAGIALAVRRAPVVLQGIPVDLPDVKLPPPDGFRSGAQPDPAHPSNPNRGRYFGEWTQSRDEATSALHSATLMQFAPDARGTIVWSVWLTKKGDPSRCSNWKGSGWVVDGRVTESMWTLPVRCGAGYAVYHDDFGVQQLEPQYEGGKYAGCNIFAARPVLEQRGPELGMLLDIRVEPQPNLTTNRCSGSVEWYVDVLWQYRPTPAESGTARG